MTSRLSSDLDDGANAERYNMVCSNVLEAVASGSTGTTGILPVGNGSTGTTGILPVDDDCVLSWRADVNSNAYYFVDVVAERGPAPIYFTGDRDSRLGNPVVVALAGVTNRVPLLIGVDYAVTSDTPFTVSFPIDYIHPTVTTNGVADYNVRWPLDFVFTESIGESTRVYTATVEPYDPGGAFTSDPPLRGAPCGCVSFSGNTIVFGCSPTCDCGGICKKGILYYLLGGAAFASTGGVCRCGFDDPAPPDPISYDPTDMPSLSITFSKQAVVFDDECEICMYQRWCHTTLWGAGVWHAVNEFNGIEFDESRIWTWPQPWSEGTLSWTIPYGWRLAGSTFNAPVGQINPPSYSVWTMSSNFIEKTKHSHTIGVSANGQMYLDGSLRNGNP